MKALVQCPNGHRFRCDPAHLGRRAKCPSPDCGASFTLTQIDEAPSEQIYNFDEPPPQTPAIDNNREPATAIADQSSTANPPNDDQPSMHQLLYGHRAVRADRERRGPPLTTGKRVLTGVVFLICAFCVFLLGSADFSGNDSRGITAIVKLLGPVFPWLCYLIAAGLAVCGIGSFFSGKFSRKLHKVDRALTTQGDSLRSAGVSAPNVSTVADDNASIPTAGQRRYQRIRMEMTELNKRKAGWVRGAAILGLSLLLFVALGLFRFDLAFIGLLIVVLLLHESGHLLAMLGFGYSNVQMFFIPLFGAAVSGHKTVKSGSQEAIIAMAGPLPSLLLGYTLLFAGVSASMPTLVTFAGILIVLNGFNLLPIFPLDGGRVLNDTLFIRSRVFEIVFRAVTAGCILVIALFSRDIFFGIFGLLMLFSVNRLNTIGRVVHDLRLRLPEGMYGDFELQPDAVQNEIIHTVVDALPEGTSDKLAARDVRDVWQRLNTKPPSAGATFSLLALYITSLLSVFIVPLIILILMISGVANAPASGPLADFISGFRVGFYAAVQGGEGVHGAVAAGDHKALQRFIDEGADVNATDDLGQTALLLAAHAGDATAVSILLSGGADADIVNDYQVAPLHEASIAGCALCVEHLLKSAAAVDPQDHRGHTPLHYAVQEDRPRIVKLLLDSGADPTIRCLHENGDALDHALLDPPLANEAEIVRLLQPYYPDFVYDEP